jgi:peptidoglycan/xylan/chitin deacetylase (PgdA/CDA1 family)
VTDAVGAIPVLAFHAVQDGPGPLRIDATTFAGIVEALADAGATGITAAAAGRALAGELAAPPNPVVFTFDDGYASVHAGALPVLRDAGWPATIFPVTSALGALNRWDEPAQDDLRILDREQLLQLQAVGWEIGGHTHTHRSLRGAAPDVVEQEVAMADEALADILGAPPVSFAYPYGHHDAASRRIAGQRYRWCWTIGASCARPGDAMAALPRIEAWYVRRPMVARHLHDAFGSGWLAARRAARSMRAAVG